MSDQGTAQPFPALQPFLSGPSAGSASEAPPAMYASQSVITGTQGEVILTLGQTRMITNQGLMPTIGIEWLMSVALSHVVAKQIANGLLSAVEAWEKQMKVKLPDMPSQGDHPAS